MLVRTLGIVLLLSVAAACASDPTGEQEDPRDGAGGDFGSASAGQGQGLSNGQNDFGSGDGCDELHDALTQAIGEASAFPHGGVTMAVLAGSCEMWSGARGWATDQHEMRPGFLMRVGGITKIYVAATLEALAQSGVLSLDDSIEAHLPDVPHGDTITIRMLLDHRSGLYDYTSSAFFDEALAHPQQSVTPTQIVDAACALPPSFPPDEGRSYSSTGYILLGMLIEAVTGERVSSVIRAHTLEPAGLEATFFDGEELVPTIAWGYGAYGEDLTSALHPSATWTAGAMVANAADLARWVQHRAGAVAIPADAFVTPGYRAQLAYFDAEEAAVAVIVNHETASTTIFVEAAGRALKESTHLR